MKETTPSAMPPCFDKWCKRFDDLLKTSAQKLEGIRKVAIVMNAPRTEDADDIDYSIINVEPSIVNPKWVVDTYSQRNWVEVLNP